MKYFSARTISGFFPKFLAFLTCYLEFNQLNLSLIFFYIWPQIRKSILASKN
jgi:hypothetical protein